MVFWYNKYVAAPKLVTGRGVLMFPLLSFLSAVTANIVAYYIRKWLDGEF